MGFYDPLHCLHHQGGESHGPEVIQDLCVPFFGMGITIQCFHIWWTGRSRSFGSLRVHPQMLSGPAAVFTLVFVRAFTTSSVLMSGSPGHTRSPGVNMEANVTSWVLLSFSNLKRKELRLLQSDDEMRCFLLSG